MVLTQGSCSGDFTEGSRAHFILREDAELVFSGRRQTWHLQPGARGGGHRHREPVLLSVIITHWNLLHPAERESTREKKWEQKSGKEFWESGFMKHDRKVGFINHSYSSSAPDLWQRQHWCIPALAGRACNSNYGGYRVPTRAEVLHICAAWPRGKEILFTYSKLKKLLKIINVSLKIRPFLISEDDGFGSTKVVYSFMRK